MDRSRKLPVVLLADDDPDDQQFVREVWRKKSLPYELRIVDDGQELLDYLQPPGLYAVESDEPKPGLIFLDINMPRKNGIEALTEIKADPELSHIPVVMLTSTKSGPFIKQAYQLGASGYLVKPSSFQELAEVLEATTNYWLKTVEPPLWVCEYIEVWV